MVFEILWEWLYDVLRMKIDEDLLWNVVEKLDKILVVIVIKFLIY
jgi:hypothetical protein